MPIYEYACAKCGHQFEELVRLGEKPPCPACHHPEPQKILSVTTSPARMQGLFASARRTAAREGHLSHYSSAERRSLLGKKQ